MLPIELKKKFNGVLYCLPACLPARLIPSDKHNLIMAKAMGLIFSLFNITSSLDVPFGIPLYMKYTHHGLTFVPHSVFLLTVHWIDCRSRHLRL